MNTATVPHHSPPPSSVPAGPARPNSALRGVLLLLGTVLILGMIVSAGVRLFALATSEDYSGVHQVTEAVDSISLRTTATDVQVQYGQVAQPEFEFTQNRNDMTLRHTVRNEELSIVVESPARGFGFWRPSLSRHDVSDLVLTLPQDMAGVDLALRTTAGGSTVDGDFGAVQLNATAGDVHLSGSAESLRLDSTATDILVQDFATTGPVRIDQTAGQVRYHGTELPASIDVSVTASEVRFELPTGEYEIVTHTTAGGVTQNLPNTPGAERVYTFESTAGSLHLSERP